jgi:sulfur relay (sulfurtransferase) DsrC/TusE family protein
MMSQGLEQPVAEYNQWTHRVANALLEDSRLEMELSHFPVFWQQFLVTRPSLRKMLKPICLDALRKVSEDKAGPSLQKVLEALE